LQRIPIKLARSGMSLAKEAITPEGRVLCGPGTKLNEDLISRLSRQGISILTVEGHPVKLPGEKGLSERLKDIEERFSKVKDDPVLRALKTQIAEYWIVQERGEEFLSDLKKRRSTREGS